MKRRLFNVLSVACLAMGGVVLRMAWSSGHRGHTFFYRTGQGTYRLLELNPGTVTIGGSDAFTGLGDDEQSPRPVAFGHIQSVSRGSPPAFSYWPHAVIVVGQNAEYVSYHACVAPASFVVGIMALPAALALILAYSAARRVRDGHCAKCGYDLRATPGRCPECGAVPVGTTK
jgi:hypothetical protein